MRFDYYLLVASPSREIKGEFETLADAQDAVWMFGEDTYYILGYSKTRGHVVVMNEEEVRGLF